MQSFIQGSSVFSSLFDKTCKSPTSRARKLEQGFEIRSNDTKPEQVCHLPLPKLEQGFEIRSNDTKPEQVCHLPLPEFP